MTDMKSKYMKLTVFAGAMLLLTGCASDTLPQIKGTPSELPEPVMATVTGEMARLSKETRGRYDDNIDKGVFPVSGAFEDGTDACICVIPVSYADGTPFEDEIKNRMTDRKFKSVGNGKFEPVTADDAIWFYNGKEVKFRAFYPYHLKKTGNAQRPYSFDDALYAGVTDLPAMLKSQYPICTGNNRFTTPNSYNDKLGMWSITSDTPGKDIMKTYDTHFQNKFTDVLRTAEVVASAKDPNIRFTGDKGFRHRMAKINVVLDASEWNEVVIDENNTYFGSKYGMHDVKVFPHQSLCAYSPETDKFDLATSSVSNSGINEEISMRETNYFDFQGAIVDGFDSVDVGYIIEIYKTPQILIAPQTVDVYFIFEIWGDGKKLTVSTETLKNYKFESGKEYTFNVSVNGGKAIFSMCSISEWVDGESHDGVINAFK